MHVSSALKGDDGYGDCRRDNRPDRRFGDCAGGECVEAQTDAGGRSFAAKQRDGDRRGGGAIPRDSAQQDGVGGGRPERRPYGIRRIRSEAAPPVSARVRNVRARDDRYLRHLASVEGRKPRGFAPVLFMAHHDVVEADPTGWTHDPFAADIEDGKIYARGAVDTKCIWAALMEAAESLIAEGYMPPRDVYFFSSNTEEDGGDTAPHMVEHLKEIGRVPYMVLDEGGAVIDNPPLGVKGEFAAIGVAEKGIFDAYIETSASGGHASTPSLGDATAKLVSGLDDLQKNPPRAALSEPVAAMLKELAARGGFGLRLVFGNLWLFRPLVVKIMKGGSETAAMVRTTYALTQLEGSRAHNVIPKKAKGTVNVRIDPSESVEVALGRIKERFDDETTYELDEVCESSPVSPFNGDPAFEYLRRIVHSVYPDAGIAPYVQTSCSDARHFARVCPRTYRFAGILFRGDQRMRIHGQDENLDVDAYKRGIGFYIELIRHLDMLGK